jgi:hypothetical protein
MLVLIKLFAGSSTATLSANIVTGGSWTGGSGTFNPNRTTANATYTPSIGEAGTTVTLTWNVPDPDGDGAMCCRFGRNDNYS